MFSIRKKKETDNTLFSIIMKDILKCLANFLNSLSPSSWQNLRWDSNLNLVLHLMDWNRRRNKTLANCHSQINCRQYNKENSDVWNIKKKERKPIDTKRTCRSINKRRDKCRVILNSKDIEEHLTFEAKPNIGIPM